MISRKPWGASGFTRRGGNQEVAESFSLQMRAMVRDRLSAEYARVALLAEGLAGHVDSLLDWDASLPTG